MCLIHQTRQQVTARTSRTPPSRSTCVAADSVAPVVKTSSTRMTRVFMKSNPIEVEVSAAATGNADRRIIRQEAAPDGLEF